MQSHDKWITAAFLASIFILPLATLAIKATSRLQDQNALEAFASAGTEISSDTENHSVFTALQNHIDNFTDSLFLKKELISFNTELTSAMSGGSYFESTQVLAGKDNWLFYKSENDGQPIWDYMGINHFTEEELKATAENLIETENYFKNELGIPFYIIAVPNKELVYEEKMPDTIIRLNPISRGRQLADYLQANTELPYLYLDHALSEAKKDYQVYFTTDTHWNYIGAYAGLQAFFQEFYGNGAPLQSASFSVGVTDFAGDLAQLADLEKRYSIDTIYVLDESSVDPAQYRDESLLIIGDSFSERLSEIANFYYRDVHQIHIKDFQMEMVEEYNADTVIWESTERYIDTFKDVKLLEK